MNQYRKELVSPTGERYVSTSPRETNDLIYVSGYREVDESTSAAPKLATTPEKTASTSLFAHGGEVSP